MKQFDTSLSSIHSDNDYNELKNVIYKNISLKKLTDIIWIGLNDAKSICNYEWSDGSDYNYIVPWFTGWFVPNHKIGYSYSDNII